MAFNRMQLQQAAQPFLPGARAPEAEAAAEAEVRRTWEAAGKPAPEIRWASSPADARGVARSMGLAGIERAAREAYENTRQGTVFQKPVLLLPSRPDHDGDRWPAGRVLTGDTAMIGAVTVMSVSGLLPDTGGWPRRWSEPDFPGIITAVAKGREQAWMTTWKAAVNAWVTEEKVLLLRWPLEAHGEPGRPQLSRRDGPALRWPDGEEQYFVQGRRVTAWLLTQPRLLAAVIEQNVEARREEIERIGWDVLQREAGLIKVGDDEPDPGNPGQVLQLWEFPPEIFSQRERVLVCVNGSDEPDGSRRRFMLFCGQRPKSALTAAAALAGLKPEDYAKMERRT